MDDDIRVGINLHTASILLIHRIENESLNLKELLSQLKNGGTINRCIILQILNASSIEITMLIEQIDVLLDRLDRLDMDFLIEELGLLRRELVDYQKEYKSFDKSFLSYMVCPALDKPKYNY